MQDSIETHCALQLGGVIIFKQADNRIETRSVLTVGHVTIRINRGPLQCDLCVTASSETREDLRHLFLLCLSF